jgi:hypothetical protein
VAHGEEQKDAQSNHRQVETRDDKGRAQGFGSPWVPASEAPEC